MQSNFPVITIDGPSGAGKGTVSAMIAKQLGWHFLDSGAIYRVLALALMHHQIDPTDEEAIVPLAANLDVHFVTDETGSKIILEGEDVTYAIRNEKVGAAASQVAAIPRVREALLRRQRAFREKPGLIADGRDMGSVVFRDASVKIFLTASAEERARRRYLQLKDTGHDVSIDALLGEIKARDERDMSRTVAPLAPADGAFVLDSTQLNVNQVFDSAMDFINKSLAS